MIYTKDNPKLVKNCFIFEGKDTFTGVVKDENNTVIYYLNGEYHREDGPAKEWADGDKQWYLNGKRHRTDGPAKEWADGDKEWYLNGKRHREDGPAREFSDGGTEWYLNGKLHREDGPAVERTDIGQVKLWAFNDEVYGENDDFTNESWIKFVRSELLK